MTESELCGSSFDWEGGSPSVFLRPMNPALSAQQYFPEDSPVMFSEKENWGKRSGNLFTPASPLFGSLSYMSQESSCCSVLNNALIMDEEDDDDETIPTDERPSLIPADDVSPIVEHSGGFNLSDLAVIQSSPTDVRAAGTSEDRNNSSLQEFLCNPPAPVDMGFIANSPGPQWSPGIRDSFKSPNPHSVIRIESTLNFLDGMPSASPSRKQHSSIADSSLSLSAIIPTSSAIDSKTNNSSSMVSSILEEPAPADNPPPVQHQSPPREHVAKSPPPPIIPEPVQRQYLGGAEPSPVRRLTHQRSSSAPLEPLPIGAFLDDRNTSFGGPNRSGFSHRRCESPSYSVSHKTLSSEERELREAQEGRRRLLSQIRSNRRNFEALKAGGSSSPIVRPPSPRVNMSTTHTYRQPALAKLDTSVSYIARQPAPAKLNVSLTNDSFVIPPVRGRSTAIRGSDASCILSSSFRASSQGATPRRPIFAFPTQARVASADTPSTIRSFSTHVSNRVRVDVVTPQQVRGGPSIYGNHRRVLPAASFAASLRSGTPPSLAVRPAWR